AIGRRIAGAPRRAWAWGTPSSSRTSASARTCSADWGAGRTRPAASASGERRRCCGSTNCWPPDFARRQVDRPTPGDKDVRGMPGASVPGGGGSVRSVRWIPLLAVAVSSVAWAQYGPPPSDPPPPPPGSGYARGPTYGQPQGYQQPARGKIELSGFAGYQLATDAGTCCGTLVIDSSAVYGAALGYELRQGYGIELSWFYVPTNIAFRSNGLSFASSAGKAGLSEHYIQLGGVVSPVRAGRVEPYASITAGIVILSPSTLQLQDGSSLTPESSVRFAFTAALGLKVWITPMIGLRFDVRALVPVYFSGGGFYVGTGGAGVGLSG